MTDRIAVSAYDPQWPERFEDLRQRPAEVQRYSALKKALAQRLTADGKGRAAYSASKSALVEELTARSYAAYVGRGSWSRTADHQRAHRPGRGRFAVGEPLRRP
ncbi:hypothetical protein GT044_22290 [Streptomyces sp. SID335]|nr:hypothetical protein [Streptomyces sp. SID335]MYZ12136.1 hypothetical protein [Streptomyces sp. SID337]NDZ84160.1 GrpB family protein [Streptomyces sp. SID10115]NEA04246.1 GrpB family protein [Streptomyces sp. SID10116]NEB44631.1 GrpB family protein [Streptomyces sp. SID339]